MRAVAPDPHGVLGELEGARAEAHADLLNKVCSASLAALVGLAEASHPAPGEVAPLRWLGREMSDSEAATSLAQFRAEARRRGWGTLAEPVGRAAGCAAACASLPARCSPRSTRDGDSRR